MISFFWLYLSQGVIDLTSSGFTIASSSSHPLVHLPELLASGKGLTLSIILLFFPFKWKSHRCQLTQGWFIAAQSFFYLDMRASSDLLHPLVRFEANRGRELNGQICKSHKGKLQSLRCPLLQEVFWCRLGDKQL